MAPTSDKPDDDALKNRLATGQAEAFHELYQRLGPQLYRFAVSMLRESEAASDVVQSVFTKLVEQHKRLASVELLDAYVFRMTRNQVLDWLRQQRLIEPLPPELAATCFGPPNLENADWLDSMLQQFSPEDREILLLKAAGHTFASIGGIVEIPAATVATRHRRCIQRLQKLAGNQLPGNSAGSTSSRKALKKNRSDIGT